MSNEIVSKLMRHHKKLEFLAEDVRPLYEADDDEDEEAESAPGADEEYAALTDEDAPKSDSDDLDVDAVDYTDDVSEDADDDSTAPEQGSPDDPDPTEGDTSSEDDLEPEDLDIPEPTGGSGGSSRGGGAPTEEESAEGEEPNDDLEPDSDVEVHENPLENQYAVKYTMGDDIKLMHVGDSKESLSGVVDGYDTEGFYRIKWSDGTTTNGLTDIALAELVVPKRQKQQESVCVCGSSHIIKENDQMICDDCGRLYEGTLDPLTLADKSRPKGKRMIRSEAHPVSTAVKPSIAEAIKKAFSGKSLREEDDPEIEEEDAFSKLKELDNQFWTRQEEMKIDIEDLGYAVEEMNDEYIIVSSNDDENYVCKVPIEGTSRTFYLNFDKCKLI